METIKKKKRRGRRIYKKLTKQEIVERRKSEAGREDSFIRAGNEGQVHMNGKINIAKQLFSRYRNSFNANSDIDGVWFEYPLVPDSIISKDYQSKKLKYLLSLYQKIQAGEDIELKNLHNIFNANLKSKLRGRKSISSLDIKKIVDIAVIVDGQLAHAVEVVSRNKLTALQKKELIEESKQGGFVFEEILL